MKSQVVVFGCGKSSPALIRYLVAKQVSVTVIDLKQAPYLEAYPSVGFVSASINDKTAIEAYVRNSVVVISLLPPHLHEQVAMIALEHNKHFLTASYLNNEIKSFDKDVINKGLLFMMECGLDPGIDHMSAMKEIEQLKEKGAKIISFKSYTGGLVAPECADNPWQYKITWNPKNIVTAGQGLSAFLDKKQVRFVPYQSLFKKVDYKTTIDGIDYEGYYNRDSLSYIDLYQLQEAETFIRGTLRPKGFCAAWDVIVHSGVTDSSRNLEEVSVGTQLQDCFTFEKSRDEEVNRKINYLFSDIAIKVKRSWTAAENLQSILEEKWKLQVNDKDFVLMIHELVYELEGQKFQRNCILKVKGEDSVYTAMAKTVGLPLGIVANRFVNNETFNPGVHVPLSKEIYEPILIALKDESIKFEISEIKI